MLIAIHCELRNLSTKEKGKKRCDGDFLIGKIKSRNVMVLAGPQASRLLDVGTRHMLQTSLQVLRPTKLPLVSVPDLCSKEFCSAWQYISSRSITGIWRRRKIV